MKGIKPWLYLSRCSRADPVAGHVGFARKKKKHIQRSSDRSYLIVELFLEEGLGGSGASTESDSGKNGELHCW